MGPLCGARSLARWPLGGSSKGLFGGGGILRGVPSWRRKGALGADGGGGTCGGTFNLSPVLT